MGEKSVTLEDITDAIVTSAVGVVSAFSGDPHLQAASAVGLSFYTVADKHLSRKFQTWKKGIATDIGILILKKGFDFESLAEKERDRILTVVSRATVLAMQDLREEKRQYLHNAVINCIIEKSDANLQLMLMHYVEILNGWHVQMLEKFDDEQPSSGAAWTPHWKHNDEIFPQLPNVPAEFKEQILDYLIANGLLGRAKPDDGGYTQQSHITQLGQLFLKFIATPQLPAE